MQGIGANGWLGKWDGKQRDAGIPVRIIPAEHMATADVTYLHESRLLRTGEVCGMKHLDAGAAGPLQPPQYP